ncbi:MAG: WD40 repeat domain-containing protein, partial [Candidatus Hydrogenedentes bacterium]|nr:WD40 repeat domain-containing protein [Candidatus Hydrogenedentota bacterium]
MVFELARDFHDALAAMPREHPKRSALELFEEAIRRDIHFIDRHPTTLFQCMWNLCWWYDCPEAAAHYDEPEVGWTDPPPWKQDTPRLKTLLQSWRDMREQRGTMMSWLRSLRPPQIHLGTAQRLVIQLNEFPLCVAYSADGSMLVIGLINGDIHVLDAHTGRLIRTLIGHEYDVNSVKCFPTDNRAVSAGSDGTVRIWNLLTGHQITSISLRNEADVRCVDCTSDGTRIAAGSSDKVIRMWDSETGSDVGSLIGHEATIRSVAFSRNNTVLVSSSFDGTVRTWDVSNGAELKCLRFPQEETKINDVYCAVPSPHGDFLVTSSLYLSAWDLKSASPLQELQIPTGCRSLTFINDARIVAGMPNGFLVYWNTAENEHRCVSAHQDLIFCVASAQDGTEFASCSRDKTVRTWTTTSSGDLRQPRNHDGETPALLACSPDGSKFLTGRWSRASTVCAWESTYGHMVGRICVDNLGITAASFSPDGLHIALALDNGHLRIIDSTTLEVLNAMQDVEHTVTARSIEFTPDGANIITRTADDALQIWSVADAKLVARFGGHETGANVTDNCLIANQLFLCTNAGTVHIVDVATGKQIHAWKGHDGPIYRIAASPDRTGICTTSKDHTAKIWATVTGERIHELIGHTGEVFGVKFLQDQTQILTGSEDRTARLWDLQTGKEIFRLPEHEDSVIDVGFSPDGT